MPTFLECIHDKESMNNWVKLCKQLKGFVPDPMPAQPHYTAKQGGRIEGLDEIEKLMSESGYEPHKIL